MYPSLIYWIVLFIALPALGIWGCWRLTRKLSGVQRWGIRTGVIAFFCTPSFISGSDVGLPVPAFIQLFMILVGLDHYHHLKDATAPIFLILIGWCILLLCCIPLALFLRGTRGKWF